MYSQEGVQWIDSIVLSLKRKTFNLISIFTYETFLFDSLPQSQSQSIMFLVYLLLFSIKNICTTHFTIYDLVQFNFNLINDRVSQTQTLSAVLMYTAAVSSWLVGCIVKMRLSCPYSIWSPIFSKPFSFLCRPSRQPIEVSHLLVLKLTICVLPVESRPYTCIPNEYYVDNDSVLIRIRIKNCKKF